MILLVQETTIAPPPFALLGSLLNFRTNISVRQFIQHLRVPIPPSFSRGFVQG